MPNIGIVTTPSDEESFAEPIYRFVSVLAPTANQLSLFAGGIAARDAPRSECQLIDVGDGEYLDAAPLDYILFQLILCVHILKRREKLDLIYFHKGAMGLALPVILARLIGIRTCVIKIGAFHSDRADVKTVVDRLLMLAQWITFRVSHAAVAFSESEAPSIPNKNVFVAYSNYRDFEEFQATTPFDERSVDIGFVGRFTEVKGVSEMANAAVSLVEQYPKLTVRLIGDGPRYEAVEQRVAGHDRITLAGWVDHSEIAAEYNRMQVLVAPSRAEGLPTGLIEAMGCGVVVVATPVGSVGDLVEHGETGFHLPGQSPETIETTYDDIRTRDDLAAIGARAREHVKTNYSKTAAQERFASITNSLTTTRRE